MVRNHIGVAFCFELHSRYDDLTYIPLTPQLETGAVIVWKKAQIVSRTIYQFLNFVKEIQKK